MTSGLKDTTSGRGIEDKNRDISEFAFWNALELTGPRYPEASRCPPPPPPPLPHSYYSYIQVQTYICIYSRALECDPRVRENSWMCVSAFYHYRIRNEHSRSICCSRQLYNDVYNSCIANKIVLSDAN